MQLMLRCAALLAVATMTSAATAQAPVRGSAETCERWAILAAGGGAAGSLSVCSNLLKELPALREQVARLNAIAGRDEETRRDLQRFGTTLNEMARRLRPPDVRTLADAVAARLQGTQQGDGALVNEVDRLRVSLRELNQKIGQLQAQPGTQARAEAALGGDAGQAIARLDFESARRMLDSLQRIESKIDDAQGPYAANPRLLDMVRGEALESHRRAVQAGAPARCAQGWGSIVTLLAAAQDMQHQGKLNAAGLAYKELTDRAVQIVTELGVLDSLSRTDNEARQRQAALEQQSAQLAHELATRTFERRRTGALAKAHTPALRSGIAEADAMRARATGLAQSGSFLDAADLMIDGANLFGRIESEGGHYSMPLQDIPKAHRMTIGRAQLPSTPAFDAASVLPGGACR